jgi:5-methylthioribose kinase
MRTETKHGSATPKLDIEDFRALEDYLGRHGHIGRGETIACEKLAGGVSNKTIKVVLPGDRTWVLKQALAKLRVDSEWYSDPQRIHVEANGLRWLNRLAPPDSTPAFLWEDRPNHVIAMESVPAGHQNWKLLLLKGDIKPEHFEQSGRFLGTIHRRSYESADELRLVFEETRHFETLRLHPYYVYTSERIQAARKFFHDLIEATRANRLALVHGDFSPKNTLINRDKLIILDYEVIHFGDPAFDLGFALTHFLSKAHHLPAHRTSLLNATNTFWRRYFEEISRLPWARDVEARAVRHALGCLLARVAGKSPLEYLSSEESSRQRDAVLGMISSPPCVARDLIDEFIRKIEN